MKILILALLLLGSFEIKAQVPSKSPIDFNTAKNVDDFIKLFDNKLNLSEVQKKEFIKIRSKIQQAAIDLLEDETIKTKDDYIKARLKIQSDINLEINRILNTEQQKTYKLWQQAQQDTIKKK